MRPAGKDFGPRGCAHRPAEGRDALERAEARARDGHDAAAVERAAAREEGRHRDRFVEEEAAGEREKVLVVHRNGKRHGARRVRGRRAGPGRRRRHVQGHLDGAEAAARELEVEKVDADDGHAEAPGRRPDGGEHRGERDGLEEDEGAVAVHRGARARADKVLPVERDGHTNGLLVLRSKTNPPAREQACLSVRARTVLRAAGRGGTATGGVLQTRLAPEMDAGTARSPNLRTKKQTRRLGRRVRCPRAE